MKKILITGASGFVGGFLVEEALNRNLEVYAAVRKTSNTQYLLDERIKLVYIDFEDQAALENNFSKNKFDYVVHNAGLTKSPTKEQYFRVNAEYLLNLQKAIITSDSIPEKFTFVSSLAAYGPAEYTQNGKVGEDVKPNPVTNYGRSKLAGEKYLKEQTQIPWSIIRPTVVYGPREWDLFTVYDLMNKRLDLNVGLNDQLLTFVYVRDLVRVILDSTLEKKINQAYFVSDLNVYTSSEFGNLLKKTLDRKALKIRLPIPLVKIIAYITEKIGGLSGKYPPLNLEKVNELEAKSWVIDTTPLVNNLNFVPEYNLEEGLKETIAWYRSKNLLK